MLTILIHGALGKMGRLVAACAMEQGLNVAAGVDKYAAGAKLSFPLYESLPMAEPTVDVLLDFSRPDALDDILAFALPRKLPLVLATTGYSPAQTKAIEEAAQTLPIFKTANMSLGVNVLLGLARQAAADLADYDAEIVETHHNTKVDAPSGTALLLAGGIREGRNEASPFVFGREGESRRTRGEIGLHAVRGGNVVGDHQIAFFGEDETVTLTHHAASRRIFALGALKAAHYVAARTPGLYDMRDLLLQNAGVTKLTRESGQVLVTLQHAEPAHIASMLAALAAKDVNVDCIASAVPGEVFSFTIAQTELDAAGPLLGDATLRKNVVKLSVVGAGMEKQRGIAAGVFGQLAAVGALPLAVTTSETQITLLMNEADEPAARQALAKQYGLNNK